MSRYVEVDDIKMAMSLYGFSSPDQTITEFVEDTLPTADVQPVKRGEWKSSRPDAPMFGFYYCSLCGRKRTSPQDKYCPNCGADMRGENNGE